MKAIRVMAWAFSIFCAGGCGGATPESVAPTSPGPTAGDQASVGAKLYGDHCASCHGVGGEGNAKVPALVGKNALPLDPQPPSQARKSKFHTAADVFLFVKSNMPPDAPGSLSDEQYAAILAFDLKANGVDLGGKKVDMSTAPSFVLHP
jgi:S-disulfanyl-L-cysteine oxidoreductase SoxD